MQLLSKKVLHTCCFSYFSFYRGHANAILSVMQFFSKVLFLDLFFFVIQYPQRKCAGDTHCDAVFPKSTFYRSVLFHISVPTEDMRRPYSLRCNNSLKKSYMPVVYPTSVFTEEMQTPYVV